MNYIELHNPTHKVRLLYKVLCCFLKNYIYHIRFRVDSWKDEAARKSIDSVMMKVVKERLDVKISRIVGVGISGDGGLTWNCLLVCNLKYRHFWKCMTIHHWPLTFWSLTISSVARALGRGEQQRQRTHCGWQGKLHSFIIKEGGPFF